jgi:hypothetical protein
VRDLAWSASELYSPRPAYTPQSMIEPDRASEDSWFRSSESSCAFFLFHETWNTEECQLTQSGVAVEKLALRPKPPIFGG